MSKMLAVVGPTASGKSDLAIELCRHYGGEVISCDSMQIYKKMNIGTAKPTSEEMQNIPHHLIDFIDVGAEYSVSDYVADAEKCVNELFGRGVLPVFCGGTGLYVDSFLSGIEFSDFENDPAVRKRLEDEFLCSGIETIYERLCKADPDIAVSIDVNNTKRVIRALEVYETTGVTMTEWNKRSRENANKKDCLVIGLDYEDRATLYERIDKRVDIMMENGLEQEVKSLIEEGCKPTYQSMRGIGYKEWFEYFEGRSSKEEVIALIKKHSRNYAKRQFTWFNNQMMVNWYEVNVEHFEETVNKVKEDLINGHE